MLSRRLVHTRFHGGTQFPSKSRCSRCGCILIGKDHRAQAGWAFGKPAIGCRDKLGKSSRRAPFPHASWSSSPPCVLLWILRYSFQTFFRTDDTLFKADCMRDTPRFFILLPRLLNITVHLGKLAKIVYSDRAASVALLVPHWRCDHSGQVQSLLQPCSTTVSQLCARRRRLTGLR